MGRPLRSWRWSRRLRLLCALGCVFGALSVTADQGSADRARAENPAADRAQIRPPPSQRENRALAGWPLGAFKLIDHLGQEFTQVRLRGQWTFVLFGDTRCGDACSGALSALAGLVKRIARTEAVRSTQVLLVSLDPEHDTAPRLRDYLARFDAGFIGASGARLVLKQLLEETGLGAAVAAAPELEHASHSSRAGSLVLIGPDGAIRVEYLPPFDVRRLTAEFLKTRARG